jgi:Protein of unknown function (DUF1592)/Protein of unknown function (DUF1588)/Protein of unknown function (DUF1595)/Protein of unknown function (DUF1587)/Protein of unknown function (DUF1585)
MLDRRHPAATTAGYLRPMRWTSDGGPTRGARGLVGAAILFVGGCYSGLDDAAGADGTSATDGGSESEGPEPVPEGVAEEIGVSGLRRLSIAEYEQTVVDLLGLPPQQVQELLPADTLTPFDNDFTTQTASEALVKGLELLAGDVAEAVVESPELREALVPCTPTGPDDAACFREFLAQLGRRALRRPLDDAELDRFAALQSYAIDEDDFWAGVSAGLRLLLQHPEFVYRVELGEPTADDPALFRLNGYEVGTRLSYLLVGSTPPDWLLDAAEAGQLDEGQGIADAAAMLLEDPRARARIARFHALWLAYENLSREGIYGDMHAETRALVERVVFDETQPWTEMLTASETFVTPELAEHYGLPAPAAADWVPYGDSGRGGLLSHGAFLSVGTKFGDTSPTQRGLLVRTKLFCQEIPKPPPDLMVDVCEPPMADPDACKIDRYFMSTEQACQGCHALMDPIGFGLERYDASGALRTAEAERPECVIPGDGEFVGVGTFNGPAELAALAVESGLVEACVARQLYRFAVGRTALDDYDEAFLARLVQEGSAEGGLELVAFIGAYVGSDAFRYRREEG